MSEPELNADIDQILQEHSYIKTSNNKRRKVSQTGSKSTNNGIICKSKVPINMAQVCSFKLEPVNEKIIPHESEHTPVFEDSHPAHENSDFQWIAGCNDTIEPQPKNVPFKTVHKNYLWCDQASVDESKNLLALWSQEMQSLHFAKRSKLKAENWKKILDDMHRHGYNKTLKQYQDRLYKITQSYWQFREGKFLGADFIYKEYFEVAELTQRKIDERHSRKGAKKPNKEKDLCSIQLEAYECPGKNNEQHFGLVDLGWIRENEHPHYDAILQYYINTSTSLTSNKGPSTEFKFIKHPEKTGYITIEPFSELDDMNNMYYEYVFECCCRKFFIGRSHERSPTEAFLENLTDILSRQRNGCGSTYDHLIKMGHHVKKGSMRKIFLCADEEIAEAIKFLLRKMGLSLVTTHRNQHTPWNLTDEAIQYILQFFEDEFGIPKNTTVSIWSLEEVKGHPPAPEGYKGFCTMTKYKEIVEAAKIMKAEADAQNQSED